MTNLVYTLPCHATETTQLATQTNNQQNIHNNKRKNSKKDVPSEDVDPNMVWSRMKQSMSHNMIKKANENIDTFLPLLKKMCIKEKNNLSMSNKADRIDQAECIKNLFRQTILLKSQPTLDLANQYFSNSAQIKRTLIQWFGISAEYHGALEPLLNVVENKYGNDLDAILHLTDPVRQNNWHTKQAQNLVSQLSDRMEPEDAKTPLKHCFLGAIQNKDTNASKEKLKQCTNDPQKAEY